VVLRLWLVSGFFQRNGSGVAPAGFPATIRAMKGLIEELDYSECPLGEIILRRRKVLNLEGQIVYDVILNNEFLMSSLFHAAEDALADLGLEILAEPAADVVVGGLGLGYTAAAALRHAKVRSLAVVEFLEPVIRWHREGLLPVDPQPDKDPRTTIVHADFFALAAAGNGFDPARPGARAHAILLDIDHTHRHWLHPRHAAFYTHDGLSLVRKTLHPGGVFAMWADGLPDPEFRKMLADVFGEAEGRAVSFPNPHTGGESASTVYLAGGTLGR
jgi:spermidine synthase